jgi:hypothetical protein
MDRRVLPDTYCLDASGTAWLPPLQDGELVAQDQDLGDLPGLITPSQPQPGGRPRGQEKEEPHRRHMTDDHHGRAAAERATLLVTAMDEILGTHRIRVCKGLR